jgi:hypothetical protein
MIYRNARRVSLVVAAIVAIFILAPVLPSAAQDGGEIEFVGTINALSLNTVTINQQVLNTDAAEINAPLQVGTVVRIEGALNADGTITVREINSVEDGILPGEAEIIGVVQSVNATTLVINGQTIDITGAQINQPVAVGELVKLHVTMQGSTVVAR